MKLLIPLAVLILLVVASLGDAAEPTRELASPSTSPADTDAAAELTKLEAADDAAQAEVDKWTRENKELKTKGAGISDTELEHRVAARFEPVREAYEDFVRRHPANARARLVFGSFLNDRQDEHGAQIQWEKALELDSSNAAVYNNLAGRYTEVGPVNKVFEYFAKAIELGPSEPVYYRNFADSLYVLRGRAATFYGITEQQVLSKVILMYSNALRLDPRNFAYARDLAQTYYSVKPFPAADALGAWTNALGIAREETDREDAHVHLARVKMLTGSYAEARAQLTTVTNETYLKAKARLLQNIAEREKQNP